ncbi:MAG: DUF4224 domain-containing protein [Gallionella sp.]
MTLFLTDHEIIELTGYQVAHYQARWLEAHAYPFERTMSGKPRVLRAYVEKRLGLATDLRLKQTEPDFSHWKQ